MHRVFVDPRGSHCITTVLHAAGAETYYIHAKWARPRVLSRLKGLVVNAVAWNRQQITEGTMSSFVVLDLNMVGIYLVDTDHDPLLILDLRVLGFSLVER